MRTWTKDYDSVPIVTYALILICILVYGLEYKIQGSTTISSDVLLRMGARSTDLINSGQYYRLFTPIFLHVSLMHLVSNMVALYFLGQLAEEVLGHAKFLGLFMFGGVFGNIVSNVVATNAVSAGASTSIFAIIGMFTYFWIVSKDKSLRSASWMVVVIGIINLVTTQAGTDLAGHLGGLIGGFILGGALGSAKYHNVGPLVRILFWVFYLGLAFFLLVGGVDIV